MPMKGMIFPEIKHNIAPQKTKNQKPKRRKIINRDEIRFWHIKHTVMNLSTEAHEL